MTEFRATLLVELKRGVLDPQGQTVRDALQGLGFPGVREVRVGKVFRLRLRAASAEQARRLVEAMAEKLLVNPVIEESQLLSLEPLQDVRQR